MGTRSTLKIYKDGLFLMGIYKQYDGFTDDWGKKFKDFLKSKKFVNGFTSQEAEEDSVFNGIGDFALRLVGNFKHGVGDLCATNEEDSQEFNYKINYIFKENEKDIIEVSCLEDESFNETIEVENDR